MMRVLIWFLIALKVCVCYHHTLLFNTQKDLRITVLTKPQKKSIIVKDLQDAIALDYLYNGSLICWTDHTVEQIDCISFNGLGLSTANRTTFAQNVVPGNRTTVAKSLPSPDGLACDWLTKKLYWTDSESKRIEVISLETKYRHVLIWLELDQPRGIALDATQGLMFWSDWGEVPKIERCSMDGDHESRQVIVSENVEWPNGVSLDIQSKHVYWVDGKLHTLEVTDYDGRGRRRLVEKGLAYPFAATVFNGSIYCTDWKLYSVFEVDPKYNGSLHEVIHFTEQPIFDIKAYDPSRQPYKWTPCEDNNGNCSHLCLLSSTAPQGYRCACPTGIKLVDERTCASRVEQFILLVQRATISRISLDTPDYTNMVLPLRGIKHATGIDYNPVDGYIYWTDMELKSVRRAKLDGSRQETIINSDVVNPDGIAVDWMAGNLYWSDTTSNRIEVFRLNTTHRKVVIFDDLEDPRAVVVSPQHGWLFWSDWNDKKPKIERSDLDGSNRVVIVKTDITWPNGLALDFDNRLLYFGDAKTDKIEVVTMEGRDRREVLGDNLPHIFSLSLLKDNLYWTDWQRRTLEMMNKYASHQRFVILDQLVDVMGIKAVNLNAPLGDNPCAVNNGGCAQFCFSKPGNRSVCACQVDYELHMDNRSCVVPLAYLLLNSNNRVRRVSVQSTNSWDVIPVTGIKSISAMDVDVAKKRLYWADNKMRVISRSFLNGSKSEKIVAYGIQSPESLAIDGLSANLYWADPGTGRIEVARLNGQKRRTLFWRNLKEPRNLVLDPREGLMFWSEWDRGMASITKATMNGEFKMAIWSDAGRVNGLTIDYSQRKLIWTHSRDELGSIEECDYTGENRRYISSPMRHKPYLIAQNQDSIFWTRWNDTAVFQAHKWDGDRVVTLYSNPGQIADVKIIDSSKQTGWNACVFNNGNCSNLCLPRPGPSLHTTDADCVCPTHYTLRNGACYPPTNFLLISQRNTVSRMTTDMDECPDAPLFVSGLKSVRAIEYDSAAKQIYWIDGKALTIKHSLDNGAHNVAIVGGNRHNNDVYSHLFDIALEPISQVLFWSCSATDTINVTRLSNSSLGCVFKGKTGERFEKPRNLALHPERGLLFWTDVGSNQRIVQARLDGEKQTTIDTDGQIVDALTVDRRANLLFFAYANKLFEFNLAERTRRLLLSTGGKRITSVAAIQSFLYWVDRDAARIERVRVDANMVRDRAVVVEQMTHISDLIAVGGVLDEAYVAHPCSAHRAHGNCTHLCVRSIENPKEAECVCPIGLKLKEDRRTCYSQPPCGPDSFTCASGAGDCIPTTWKCDGQSDCQDGSDEEGCQLCGRYDFKCGTGHCVPSIKLCDGYRDCPDSSDEFQCCSEELLRTGGPYFQCVKDLSCVPSVLVCDGIDQCADGSDEAAGLCNNHALVKSDNYVEDSSGAVVWFAVLTIFGVLAVPAFVFVCCRKKFKRPLATDTDVAAMRPLAPGVCPQIGGALTAARVVEGGLPLPHSMTNGGGDGSTGSYGRSHITGASSSTSMNNCPLNPPPSPTTTIILQEECCCNQYPGLTPTPCSTDVCDESDTNYRADSDMYVLYRNSSGNIGGGVGSGSVSYHKRPTTERQSRHRTRHGHGRGRYPRNGGIEYEEHGMPPHSSAYKKTDFDLVPPPTPRSSSDPPSPSSSTYFSPMVPHPPPPSPTNH